MKAQPFLACGLAVGCLAFGQTAAKRRVVTIRPKLLGAIPISKVSTPPTISMVSPCPARKVWDAPLPHRAGIRGARQRSELGEIHDRYGYSTHHWILVSC